MNQSNACSNVVQLEKEIKQIYSFSGLDLL